MGDFRGIVVFAAFAAAVALVGCSAPTPKQEALPASMTATATTTVSPKERIEGWRQENGDTFSALGDSFSDLGNAMKTGTIPPVKVACTGLGTNLNQLSYALPTPDVGLTTALQGMVDDMKAALRLCDDFDSTTRGADVREFSAVMKQARGKFDIAAAILKDARDN